MMETDFKKSEAINLIQCTTGHFYKILFACEKERSTLWVSAEAVGQKSKHAWVKN